jgi:hypothetical protein
MAYDGPLQSADLNTLATVSLQTRPGGASIFTSDVITIMDDGFHSGELSVTIFVTPQNRFFDLIGSLLVMATDRFLFGPLEFELPEETVRLVFLYVQRYLPVLATRNDGFLLPGKFEGHKSYSSLAQQVKSSVTQG